jgi:tRNA-Thr(GGU) m(6)t(6)A37 methyltransferase TsaA
MIETSYTITPIGVIHSELKSLEDAPRQGYEGAPEAWLEIDPSFAQAAADLEVEDAIILITWLHKSDRSVMKVHPRSDETLPLTGVFATRSPDRPNPLGLHRVTVLEIAGNRLRVAPLEAIDGTPVIDIKIALAQSADS